MIRATRRPSGRGTGRGTGGKKGGGGGKGGTSRDTAPGCMVIAAVGTGLLIASSIGVTGLHYLVAAMTR